ncbi:MAG: glycosyl transferase, partial [Nitrospirae bacterium]|nr:glycosyl transferase [Nitrospirota bacterium]
FDRHEETKAVEAFANAIKKAAQIFIENPMGTPLIPNWNRIGSAIPGIFDMLKKAVDEDNK